MDRWAACPITTCLVRVCVFRVSTEPEADTVTAPLARSVTAGAPGARPLATTSFVALPPLSQSATASINSPMHSALQ